VEEQLPQLMQQQGDRDTWGTTSESASSIAQRIAASNAGEASGARQRRDSQRVEGCPRHVYGVTRVCCCSRHAVAGSSRPARNNAAALSSSSSSRVTPCPVAAHSAVPATTSDLAAAPALPGLLSATPVSTPVANPASTCVANPVSTPVATPVSNPVANPVANPA
jgi:hypothetical protein